VACHVDPNQVKRVWKKEGKDGPKRTKEGRDLHGIWGVGSDSVAMSDNQITDEETTQIAAPVGACLKFRVTYAAPAREVIKALARRKQLHSVLMEWQNAQAKNNESSDNDAA
jgi:hypothetical protein